jgi:hypothetical protein
MYARYISRRDASSLRNRKKPVENLTFPTGKFNRNLSTEATAIIKKALAPDMDKRFQGALEMKQAIQKVMLDSAVKGKGAKKFIAAQTGKVIKLPWWKKTSLVSVPVMALGCSGTTGTLPHDL